MSLVRGFSRLAWKDVIGRDVNEQNVVCRSRRLLVEIEQILRRRWVTPELTMYHDVRP